MEHGRTRTPAGINFRAATIDDCALYFKWANDDLVRKNSFNSDKISYDSHIIWFNNKINSAKCKMLVAECDGVSIGQIRLDFENDGLCIDISVDKSYRSIGFGTKMLTQLGPYLQAAGFRGNSLNGIVKSGNKTSQKAFESAGFLELSRNETEFRYRKLI